MPRRTRTPKAKKQKRVAYQLVPHDSQWGKAMYPMLVELVEAHHEELTNARIALAWNLSWKPDVDGRVKLGQCKKRSDLDREFEAFDFVIVLRQEFWQAVSVNDKQRRALLDHELCYATVKLGRDGEPLLDERGRTVWRTRKHDIQEFSEIVARHGVYTRDLEHFATALRQSRQKSLLDEVAPPPAPLSLPATDHIAGSGEKVEAEAPGNGKADQAFAFDGKEPAPRAPRAHPGINPSRARTRPKGRAKGLPKGPLARRRQGVRA